jgi:hypothetical protein
MTLTGYWNRAWERPRHFETRDELVREEQKWRDALALYHKKVDAYVLSGGKISRSRELGFECIVSVNLKELRNTIEARDFLAGAILIHEDQAGRLESSE